MGSTFGVAAASPALARPHAQSVIRRNIDTIRGKYGGGPDNPLSAIYWPRSLRATLTNIIDCVSEDVSRAWQASIKLETRDVRAQLDVSTKEHLDIAYKRAALRLLDLVFERSWTQSPFKWHSADVFRNKTSQGVAQSGGWPADIAARGDLFSNLMGDSLRHDVVDFVLRLMETELGGKQVMLSTDPHTPSDQAVVVCAADGAEVEACEAALQAESARLEERGFTTLLPRDVCRVKLSSTVCARWRHGLQKPPEASEGGP